MVRKASRNVLAFTLVELLVVIGIIALLISILLPVLNKVKEQANTVSCSAQLRSVMQGVLIYATNNKGTLPCTYQLLYMNANGSPGTGNGSISAGTSTWYNRYSWTTQIMNTLQKDRHNGMWPDGIEQPATILNQQPKLPKAFRCTSVTGNGTFENDTVNFSCYVANPVAMPNRSYEVAPGSGGSFGANGLTPLNVASTATTTSIGSARQSQLYSDNAILWEAGLFPAPPGYYYPSNLCGQYNWSCVDSGNLLYPQYSFLRYRNQLGAMSASYRKIYTDDQPIWMPTAKSEKDIYATMPWANADSFGGVYFTDYFTGPIYRHQKSTVCNVAFADGSVRGLKWNNKKIAFVDSYGYEVAQNEFVKGMIRIKASAPLPTPQVPGNTTPPEY